MQEASKLADAIAASEEHVEELKARITARQDWITREQQSVDAKIEEATRPVASERTEAAEQHRSLQEEVDDLRYSLGTVLWCKGHEQHSLVHTCPGAVIGDTCNLQFMCKCASKALQSLKTSIAD